MARRVRTFGAIVAASMIGTVLLADSAGAAQRRRHFNLVMSGAQEVNSSGARSNPHGNADRGIIRLRLDPGREEVCWSVRAIRLTAGDALPSAAHIHEAPAGVAGPVVVPLFDPSTAPTSYPTGTRCASASRTLIAAMMRNPSGYYVNLHNAQHPGGVMRAQLGRRPPHSIRT